MPLSSVRIRTSEKVKGFYNAFIRTLKRDRNDLKEFAFSRLLSSVLLNTAMKQIATITVIGKDRSGVVARFTSLLFEQGANIEALEEQVTRGQFSMIIQASWPRSRFEQPVIERELSTLASSLKMEVSFHFKQPHRAQRMALMVTKEPHCLTALLTAVKRRKLKVDPVVIVSNRKDLLPVAKEFSIPFHYVPWEADRQQAERSALEILQRNACDFVVLARFMKILSPNFVWRYKNKIINIHPSLLPSFPGPQPYRQAYEHGVKMAGVTAHFVSMHLDEGPIIAQDGFHVSPRMSLKQIIQQGQKLESKVLTKAVELFLTRKLDVHWGVVKEV